MTTYSFKPYFFYVYRITNIQENKHYYGSKYSKKTAIAIPKEHIGSIYFSSSTDKEFIKDQKEKPHLFKYKVIKVFNTPEQAIALEIRLHAKFDVKNHTSFYNNANQTSTRFNGINKGSITIHQGKLEKKINPDDLSEYQEAGWIKGSSKETIAKRTAAQSGLKRSVETRDKMSAAQTGKTLSDEHKAKLSAAKTGKLLSTKAIAKRTAAQTGLKRSDATKTNISAARTGKILIHNIIENKAKMINPQDFSEYEESGWLKGILPKINLS